MVTCSVLVAAKVPSARSVVTKGGLVVQRTVLLGEPVWMLKAVEEICN